DKWRGWPAEYWSRRTKSRMRVTASLGSPVKVKSGMPVLHLNESSSTNKAWFAVNKQVSRAVRLLGWCGFGETMSVEKVAVRPTPKLHVAWFDPKNSTPTAIHDSKIHAPSEPHLNLLEVGERRPFGNDTRK